VAGKSAINYSTLFKTININAMNIPEWKLVKLYFGYGALLYIQFFFVYGGSNWFASESSARYQLFFSWERHIPFTPLFIIPYLSLSLYIILPVFYLDLDKVKPWAKSYMLMVFFAGFIFLVMPTENVIVRSEYFGEVSYLFNFLYTMDLPYNLFPSLHVSLSTLALMIMLPQLNNKLVFVSIVVWWFIMTISVILVRQHNVSDIAGGVLLAWLCYRFIYFKSVDHV
jgi:membrane-associated phospholipid phosphatase